MWADVLTKERNLYEDLKNVLLRNEMKLGDTTKNQVKAFGQHSQQEDDSFFSVSDTYYSI